jgi:hypothetical protein
MSHGLINKKVNTYVKSAESTRELVKIKEIQASVVEDKMVNNAPIIQCVWETVYAIPVFVLENLIAVH